MSSVYISERGNTMDKITINIDPYKTRKKPEKWEKHKFIRINERVAKHKEDLTLDEIIHEVGENKRAFSRAVMKNNQRNGMSFEKQIFLILDFDDNPDPDRFKQKCEDYGLKYTFRYQSLRYSSKNKKFRAVFMLDHWITDSRIAKLMNNILLEIFDERDGQDLKADINCKDLARMFLGGKKLIDVFKENRMSVMDVVHAFHAYYRIAHDKNYVRDLKSFAKKLGVAVIDNRLAVYDISDMNNKFPEEELVKDGNIVMILDDNKKRSKSKASSKNEKINSDTEKPILSSVIVKKETLMEMCPLFKEYVEGKDIEHSGRFHLATNLRFFKGGRKWFFEALPDSSSVEKWKRAWEYNARNEYLPRNCEDVCKYAEQCGCRSIYSKLKSRIRKFNKQNLYISLEECQEQLKTRLENAVNSEEDNIFVIKAQTALGKTETYCNLINSEQNKKFIIAVPTCRLQSEVAERLAAKGVECIQTMSIYESIKKLGLPDLTEMVDQLYADGYGRFVVKKIREYKREKYDKLTEYQRNELNKLTGKKQGLEQARCIVTTHAYFHMMNLDSLNEYEIIIDEDPVITLFRRNWSMPVKDIETVIEKRYLSPDNTEKLKQILKMEDQETCQIDFVKPRDSELDRLYEKRHEINGPLPLLLESSFLVMDQVREEILFCKKMELPQRKIIILSASANEEIYKNISNGENRVHFMEIPPARYKGKVIQYTAHTMSRKCIKNVGEEEVKKKVKKISGDIPWITFKMMETVLYQDTDSALDIHFGKTEGFDSLKGKNIAIVGTPHNRPVLYKLLGVALGYKTTGSMTVHRIKRNNYEFPFMTFANESMRNLQLFLIETELEQAIGRARVFREDCTVYVFSNYPCQQAELNMEPYLDITVEEETEDEEEIKE